VGLLIDTNVLAELHKGARADVGVLRWFDGVGEDKDMARTGARLLNPFVVGKTGG
jgi:hypothetical protein